MKKLIPFVVIFILAVLLGTYLFKDKSIVSVQIEKHTAIKTKAKEVKDIDTINIPENIVKKEQSDLMIRLKSLIQKEAASREEYCKEVIEKKYSNKEYLDSKSGFFDQEGARNEVLEHLNKISGDKEENAKIEELMIKILQQDNWDPFVLKNLMMRIVLCQNIEITNLTYSLIVSLKSNDLDKIQRNKKVIEIISLANSYTTKYSSIEYTLQSMEVLMGLIENDNALEKYLEEFNLLRQRIIAIIQEFETDFKKENTAQENRSLIRNYHESIRDLNDNILSLTDRMQYDLPDNFN